MLMWNWISRACIAWPACTHSLYVYTKISMDKARNFLFFLVHLTRPENNPGWAVGQLPMYKYNKYQHSLLTVLGQVRHQIFWKSVVITLVSDNTNDRSGKKAIRSLQQTPFDYPRSTAYISVALWWVIAETGGKNSERWLAPERAFRSPDVRIQSLIIGT